LTFERKNCTAAGKKEKMATYTYECKTCGVFEAQQSMKEDSYTACPKCSSKEIKRIISRNVNFILKGSGFYSTENRSCDYKQAEAADKGTSCSCSGTCPHKA